MSRVLKFLNELDDHELAFFAKYRKSSYMKETQEIISDYLLERNFSDSKIEDLIANNPKAKFKHLADRCPRCYSNNFRKNKVEWTNTVNDIGPEDEIATLDGIGGRATYKDEVVCNVCGYWLKDPNSEKPKSFRSKVARYFGDVITGILDGL